MCLAVLHYSAASTKFKPNAEQISFRKIDCYVLADETYLKINVITIAFLHLRKKGLWARQMLSRIL
jgi:hypothetical protein